MTLLYFSISSLKTGTSVSMLLSLLIFHVIDFNVVRRDGNIGNSLCGNKVRLNLETINDICYS